MKILFTFLALFFAFGQAVFAQSQDFGILSGKIIDARDGLEVIGATVRLDSGQRGAATDIDGLFSFEKVAVGTHKITVSFIGFSTKTIENIEVKNAQPTALNILLEEPKTGDLAEVVIVATAKKESNASILLLQKNSASMADAISSETIRRTPDRSASDVLKRVSGASIQDNKFAIIRGLSDRYNVALLNGGMLSSTEPDRKAFAFDLFPANMLDNLVIMKTASPDLPGDFAGGAIILNTRDVPENSFFQAQIGAGHNSITTFRTFEKEAGGKLDWLGIDDETRAMPTDFPSKEVYFEKDAAEKIRLSKLFKNNWATEKTTALPNLNGQVSGGLNKKMSDGKAFGLLASLSYNRSNRLQEIERNDFDQEQKLFEFSDENFKTNVLAGGLLNSAFSFSKTQKLVFQSSFTINTDQTTIKRTGRAFDAENNLRATSTEFIENRLLTTRLAGEHAFGAARLNWGAGLNRSARSVPDSRRNFFIQPFGDEAAPFTAAVPFGSANRALGGRFFSEMDEKVANANVDFSLPFFIKNQKQTLKMGGLFQQKDRDFAARILGMKVNRAFGFDFSKLKLPENELFAAENISETGFLMDEITNRADAYSAKARLGAGFLMLDNRLGKARLAWGVRLENFDQKLASFDYTDQAVELKKSDFDVLPSANLTVALTEKTNLRASASQTVARPEFRELAPFSFFDFYTSSLVQGNPDLVRTQISNLDVRWEMFPGLNQLVSATAFFKNFRNPIEQIVSSSGAGSKTRSFQNVPSAQTFGAEMELRKNLAFVHERLENVVFFSNLAIIRSKVAFNSPNVPDPKRGMQGQSPYVLNAGLSWSMPEKGWNAMAVFNRIGDRVHEVGFDGFADIYEKGRSVIDFSLGKKLRERGEFRLTWGDVLAQNALFYQDNNASHRKDAGDNLIQVSRLGSTAAASFSWKF